jgi:hypothetical protein
VHRFTAASKTLICLRKGLLLAFIMIRNSALLVKTSYDTEPTINIRITKSTFWELLFFLFIPKGFLVF